MLHHSILFKTSWTSSAPCSFALSCSGLSFTVVLSCLNCYCSELFCSVLQCSVLIVYEINRAHASHWTLHFLSHDYHFTDVHIWDDFLCLFHILLVHEHFLSLSLSSLSSFLISPLFFSTLFPLLSSTNFSWSSSCPWYFSHPSYYYFRFVFFNQ